MAPAAASFSESSQTVCVMDASGRLGTTLVHKLLKRGYTVHAAVHNHGKLKYFEELSCKSKKLRVFYSDPFDFHSIIEALKGCCGLFYSFEPPSDQPTYDEFMADVEVRAAHNVLEACAKTVTIHKVVFTSSVTAVIWSNDRNSTSSDLDERYWSDVNFCRKFKLWHGLSKALAEKTAWALAMDRGINMVSINGGLLMSPDLSIANPYLKGAAEMYEDGLFVTVDLSVAVDAHICVFEDVASYGRYLCFNHVINCNEDAIKLARELLPPSESTVPQSFEDTRVHQQRISNKKLNKLMVDFDSELQIDLSAGSA
ncbi:cinnamoyl-CoA reductase, putative [Ricinus communis]|uniref:Cinnamoyl-CoA reductase, putative n=1 Tax=Ricinus communis TaxID=3988 RepID=B9S247_RICCO|nr:cinnamoyl-CoA reductase, putative [Ricinus communis]|eukprot:XP_002520066.1 cinnamoyl-CoA reductase-like SNL6 [Ricinus communis]